MLELFEVRMPVAELVVRGSAIFWFLFLIFRFVMRRDIGGVGVADVLLLVIVADASQNAMAGNYTTISEGFILVGTIIGWNWLLDWLSLKFEWARRFAQGRRLLLKKVYLEGDGELSVIRYARGRSARSDPARRRKGAPPKT